MKRPQGAQLYQSSRGHRREISHEPGPARGAQSRARNSIRPAKPSFVANVLRTSNRNSRIGRIEVDKSAPGGQGFRRRRVRSLRSFRPPLAAKRSRRRRGTLKVTSADANPNYRYNPDYKFKGVKSKEAFTIKPGTEQPGRILLDRAFRGRIWHPRYVRPFPGQQI